MGSGKVGGEDCVTNDFSLFLSRNRKELDRIQSFIRQARYLVKMADTLFVKIGTCKSNTRDVSHALSI